MTMSAESGRRLSDLGWPIVVRLRAENAHLLEAARAAAERHEILLREGDHRIKNSLQVVAALMQMQARREANLPVSHALNAAAARVQSIARIHDALQSAHGADLVNLGRVVEAMCWSLQAMAGDPRTVTVQVDAEPVETPASLAQPLVLAVNELVVNALRHAFGDNRPGLVAVKVALGGENLHASVTDDGDGLPEGYAGTAGYGLTLVRAMVAQIGGTLHVESGRGARFEIVAPMVRTAASTF
jgi:two-component sensor histidine kinase